MTGTTVRLMTRLANAIGIAPGASEQIAEDGWTHEGHCRRGSRQRGQRAGTDPARKTKRDNNKTTPNRPTMATNSAMSSGMS